MRLPLVPVRTVSRLVLITVISTEAGCIAGRQTGGGLPDDPPALTAIVESDLRRDLFALASTEMRGREGGTVDELRASAWLAERAREAGLEPAGDDGTYFQFWRMRRSRVSDASSVSLGGAAIRMPDDGVFVTPVSASVDLPVVYVGEGRAADLANIDLRGKAVAALLTAPENSPPVGPLLTARRYTMLAVRQRAAFLSERGAAAVLIVSDSIGETQFQNIATGWARGSYALDTATSVVTRPTRVPVLWLRRASLARVRGATAARFVASVTTDDFVVPSVNVVARVRGTDPVRREEHILYSAHQDGLGVRYAWDGDSTWKGADDNATTSVALLAIGRAFRAAPARRSVLFVWHGSEELGLLGSRWFALHPTVPRASLAAVINGDMIGRNHPDTAALMGVMSPNRNSRVLADMALSANARVSRFAIDTSWDAPTHPEGLFQRSDHWPYALQRIPVIYFSTALSADYHTPRDEASRIDYAKLTRMSQWMYATGWAAANADQRPTLDGGRR
ncbi:MAG: M28 family peptidase [Gemmatimonadota bacterium]